MQYAFCVTFTLFFTLLESQYIALPCDFFILFYYFLFLPYLKFGSVSHENNFYTVYFSFSTAGVSSSSLSYAGDLNICIISCIMCIYCLLKMTLPGSSVAVLSRGQSVGLWLVLKKNKIKSWPHMTTRNTEIRHLSCCRGRHSFMITDGVSASLNINLVCLNAHPLYACLYSGLYWTKFNTFTSLYLRQRLVWLCVPPWPCNIYK